MKTLLKLVSVLCAVVVSAGTIATPQQLSDLPVFAPHLDHDFLSTSLTAPELGMSLADEHARIGLAVAHYDGINGLQAGYEARNGERVLMIAAQNQRGNVNARMLYLDAETGNVLPAMTLAVVGEGANAETVIIAGGVDVLKALTALRNDASARIAGRRALNEFVNSPIGQAALEAIPVLYAELEPIDRHDATLARLKAPFGAMRMAVELSAGTYAGLPAADEVFRSDKLAAMQSGCPDHLCQLRTRQFVIHANGLFDVLTDFDAALSCRQMQSAVGLTEGTSPRYENDCFGCCGPACWGCTGIYNSECFGHDQCVCEAGHLACLFGSPGGCGGTNCDGPNSATGHCDSLVSAIIGFLRDLFGFGDGGGGGGGGGYTLPPWPGSPCFDLIECNECLNNPSCVPEFPQFPY